MEGSLVLLLVLLALAIAWGWGASKANARNQSALFEAEQKLRKLEELYVAQTGFWLAEGLRIPNLSVINWRAVDAALQKLEAGRKQATLERADDVIEAISRAKREKGNSFDADAYGKRLASMSDDERVTLINKVLGMPDVQRHYNQIEREKLSADDQERATRSVVPEEACLTGDPIKDFTIRAVLEAPDTDWSEVFRAEGKLKVPEKHYQTKTGEPVHWRELGFY
jgi:hypothetical protein